MNFLKNDDGVSMIGVLMAAAMAGGVALVIAQLGKNSSTINRETVMNNDINEVYNRVQKYMLHKDSCSITLSQFTDLPIDPTAEISFGSTMAIQTQYNGGSVVNQISVGDQIGSVFIKDISFVRKSATELDLVLAIDKDRDPVKERIIKKRIELQGAFVGNNPTGCFSQLDNAIVSSAEVACLAVDPGATFNSSTLKCEYSQAYIDSVIDSLSSSRKKPIYIDPGTGLVSAVPITHRVDRTCSKCKKSGCNPPGCPSGYSRSARSCSKGDTCGFKPRWRNCRVTCSKVISSSGFLINN
jgi:hypothetical protein